MPCQFNMIFLEYLRILGTENTAGGQAPGHEGPWRAPSPWARPLPHGPTVALLHLSLHLSSSSASHKHEKPTQARVPAPVAVIFDLLAQSTSRKTAWGDCSMLYIEITLLVWVELLLGG